MRLTPIQDATIDELRELYAAVFTGPPFHDAPSAVDAWAERFATERATPGFDGVVARRGLTALGLAYGLPTPEPFPADRSYPRVLVVLGRGV